MDTDVLVHLVFEDTERHGAVRRLLRRELGEGGSMLCLVPMVIYEFLHVVTDPRRFAQPLEMTEAARWAADLCSRADVEHAPAPPLHRILALLRKHRLGRKRIHDTALAATLEAAGVRRLATFNGRDFQVFPFIEAIEPT